MQEALRFPLLCVCVCVCACVRACLRACVRASGTEKAQRHARPHSSASAVSCRLAHIHRRCAASRAPCCERPSPRTTLAVRAPTRSVVPNAHARTHARTQKHSHMHPRSRIHPGSLLSRPLSRVLPPPVSPTHSRALTCEVNDELSQRLVADTHVIL